MSWAFRILDGNQVDKVQGFSQAGRHPFSGTTLPLRLLRFFTSFPSRIPPPSPPQIPLAIYLGCPMRKSQSMWARNTFCNFFLCRESWVPMKETSPASLRDAKWARDRLTNNPKGSPKFLFDFPFSLLRTLYYHRVHTWWPRMVRVKANVRWVMH